MDSVIPIQGGIMSDLLITNVDVLTDNGTLKNHAVAIENQTNLRQS